jgi:phenol hydroxylase P0 protein
VAFDTNKKFVRVTKLRDDGFIEFEFAIGEPELFAEMILPVSGFDDFCQSNRVIFLDDRARLRIEPNAMDWHPSNVVQSLGRD